MEVGTFDDFNGNAGFNGAVSVLLTIQELWKSLEQFSAFPKNLIRKESFKNFYLYFVRVWGGGREEAPISRFSGSWEFPAGSDSESQQKKLSGRGKGTLSGPRAWVKEDCCGVQDI